MQANENGDVDNSVVFYVLSFRVLVQFVLLQVRVRLSTCAHPASLGSTPGRVESAGARRQGKQCGRRKQFNVLASKYRRITLEQVTVAVLLDNFVGASAQMEQEKEAAEILRLKMSDPVRNSILIYIQD